LPSSILAYRLPKHFSLWLEDSFYETLIAEDQDLIELPVARS
jgi:hypothetical protein